MEDAKQGPVSLSDWNLWVSSLPAGDNTIPPVVVEAHQGGMPPVAPVALTPPPAVPAGTPPAAQQPALTMPALIPVQLPHPPASRQPATASDGPAAVGGVTLPEPVAAEHPPVALPIPDISLEQALAASRGEPVFDDTDEELEDGEPAKQVKAKKASHNETGIVPPVPYHLQTRQTATRGEMLASRVLYGAANPGLVTEYALGLVSRDVLAASYGYTDAELQQIEEQPGFQKAVADIRERWKKDPGMDTRARAKAAFDMMLPAMVGTAMQPSASPQLAYKTFELMAKIADVIPTSQVGLGGGTGGSGFSINIVLQPAKAEQPFKIIEGD